MPRIEATGDVVIDLPLPGDSGDGTMYNPCSIQAGLDKLMQDHDLRGYGAKLKLRMGTPQNPMFYDGVNFGGRIPGQPGGVIMKTAPGLPPFVIGGVGRLTLEGDPANPFGAFIYKVGSPHAALSLAEGATLFATGFGMITDWQDNVDVFTGAFLGLGRVVFAGAGPPGVDVSNAISVGWGATVLIDDKTTICGPMASFADVGSAGGLYWNTNGDPGLPIEVEVIGNQRFNRSFLLVTDGGVAMPAVVRFTGAARGPKFCVMRNGVIIANDPGKQMLPGDEQGQELSGGRYI